jgi:hypothetical protein
MSDLLDHPFEDDLDKRLDAAAPRRLANRATYVLIALVIAVAGFVGGAQVQKHFGTPAAASTADAGGPAGAGGLGGPAGAGRPSGFPGGGGTTGPSQGNRAITGTVKLVDGTTVYIETSDGQTLTVRTTDGTTVLKPGTLADITVGATVTVQGQNVDGTVDATSISKAKG